MLNLKVMRSVVLTTLVSVTASASASGVYITEWMYNGAAEYVEFTNLSSSAVDFTGWSYDDDSRSTGVFDLSGFGVVAPGESVVMTEIGAEQFRIDWNLSSSVKVVGEYTNNLGRNDEINLYDALGNLIDRLTYGDQAFPGTIRTAGISGRPESSTALGANDPYLWIFSVEGDADNSFYSLNGELGSPGITAVPVPAALWLMLSGLLGLAGIKRQRKSER